MILSDVVGDPLDFIASGPTVQNYTPISECTDLLQNLNIPEHVSAKISDALQNTDKSLETISNFDHVLNVIVGSNLILIEAAKTYAEEIGFECIILTSSLHGVAKDVGMNMGELMHYISHVYHTRNRTSRTDLRTKLVQSKLLGTSEIVSNLKLNEIEKKVINISRDNKPFCLLSGGETTVNVTGTGEGGRNRELALATALYLHEHVDDVMRDTYDLVLLSAGTDGQDGPRSEGRAGAVINPYVVQQGREQGFDALDYLNSNNSGEFFDKICDGQYSVNTGLTGTNVMDMQIMLLLRK